MTSTEKEILKKILSSKDSLLQAIQLQISKELFQDSANRKLFEMVLWFYQKYSTILTADSLKKVLDRSKLKEEEKQKSILLFAELQAVNYEDKPLQFLADSLRFDYKKLQLKSVLISAVNTFEQSKIDEALDVIKSGIHKLELNSRADTHEGFIHDSTDERKNKYLDIRDHPEKYKGISTGWPSFDRITGGLRGGQLMVIVAAVKEGKSTALMNIAHNACAVENKNVMYVSVEMKKEQVERRFDARASELSYSKIRDGRLTKEEEAIYDRCHLNQKTRIGKFYVLDEPHCTPSFIRSKLSTVPLKFDLIVVDYLTILEPDSPGKDNWETIGNTTVDVRNIAREFNIPIVTAAQANREGIKESKYKYGIENVGLSHLITAHADVMLSLRLVDRDELEVNDVVEMNAATIAIRDDRGCRFTIDACFDKMMMTERDLTVTTVSSRTPAATVE